MPSRWNPRPRSVCYRPIPSPWEREKRSHWPGHAFEVPQNPREGDQFYIRKGFYICVGSIAVVELLPSDHTIKSPKINPYSPREEEESRQDKEREEPCSDAVEERGRTTLRKRRVSGLCGSALRCCFPQPLARAVYYCGAVCACPSPRDELGSRVVISSCSSFADKSEALLYLPPLAIPRQRCPSMARMPA